MKRSDRQANHEELSFPNRKTHGNILAAVHLRKILHSEPLHFLPLTASQPPSGLSPHGQVSAQRQGSIWRGDVPILKDSVS